MDYKLKQYAALIPQIQTQMKQQIHFVLEHKSKEVYHLSEKMKVSDPRLQCRSGWAQVSQNNKTVALSKIVPDDIFFLEDGVVKVEALCLSKKEI
jgi:exodeoxyribonuclease VII large subunit